MKILGISCSPRKKGSTVVLLEEVLKGASENGADTELYTVSGKDIRGCDGCYSCMTKGECHIKDDVKTIYEKMVQADGIIFGSPIYLYGMTAQSKAIIDRSFSLAQSGKSLANKVCGLVVVAGSLGIIDALKDYYFFIALSRMLPANFVAAYAVEKDDVKKLEQGIKASYNLGREMVQLIDINFKYPEEFPVNFFAFGTHTH